MSSCFSYRYSNFRHFSRPVLCRSAPFVRRIFITNEEDGKGWWWVDERERERQREENKREITIALRHNRSIYRAFLFLFLHRSLVTYLPVGNGEKSFYFFERVSIFHRKWEMSFKGNVQLPPFGVCPETHSSFVILLSNPKDLDFM